MIAVPKKRPPTMHQSQRYYTPGPQLECPLALPLAVPMATPAVFVHEPSSLHVLLVLLVLPPPQPQVACAHGARARAGVVAGSRRRWYRTRSPTHCTGVASAARVEASAVTYRTQEACSAVGVMARMCTAEK